MARLFTTGNPLAQCVTRTTLALLTLVGASAAHCGQLPALAELEAGWNTVSPGGDTLCATGAPYHFYIKPGATDKVMVFFNGGGACWKGEHCDVSSEPTPYSPRADIVHNDPRTRDGAFSLENPENPFRDWSQVFVSYCSGDVHLGARDIDYPLEKGGAVTIHHRGKANAQSALNWIYANFDTPQRIFVSGGSAGAIASPYYAAVIAEHYPETDIAHFAGGGGGYRVPPASQLNDNWGVLQGLPDWPQLKPYHADNLRFDDFYLVAAARQPGIGFHQFNSAYDWAQEHFLLLMGRKAELYPLLEANLQDLAAELPDFRSYTAAGEFHTLLRFKELYQISTNDVRAVDWVNAIANGQPVSNVTCGSAETCRDADDAVHQVDFTQEK